MSIVAGVIKHHLMIEGAMSPSHPDERSDYAQDNMDYEDYRDATEGRCGFPWESEDYVAGDAERQLNNHLATIAINMVFAMTQADWSDVGEQNDWVEFLADCFGNGFATEFVMSSWDDDGFSLY